MPLPEGCPAAKATNFESKSGFSVTDSMCSMVKVQLRSFVKN